MSSGPVPQRRHHDPDHVEPVQQIVAEPPCGDLLVEPDAGGRDDPHVDVDLPVTPDRPDLSLLQDPQQPVLDLQGDAADLVEEQGAPVRGPEQPFGAVLGAGERAANVAEQLGLEEVLRHRRAVDGHHPAGSFGAPVERSGEKLLSGTRFAQNQHGGVRGRRPHADLEHVSHPLTAAVHPFELPPFGEALLVFEKAGKVLLLVDSAPDLPHEDVRIILEHHIADPVDHHVADRGGIGVGEPRDDVQERGLETQLLHEPVDGLDVAERVTTHDARPRPRRAGTGQKVLGRREMSGVERARRQDVGEAGTVSDREHADGVVGEGVARGRMRHR